MSIEMRLQLPRHFEERATEWMLGLMKFLWGIVLLLPDWMVGRPIFSNPYFSVMASFADKMTWGVIALVCGGFHLLALYWNGTKRKSPHIRAVCSMIGMLFWLQISLGFIAEGSISTGWAIYPVACIFSFYNVMRAMGDARASDERSKAEGSHRGYRSRSST